MFDPDVPSNELSNQAARSLLLGRDGRGIYPLTQCPAVAATGTITLLADLADGESVTIGDGLNSAVTFEFDDDDNVTAGAVGVALDESGEPAANAAALLVAIIAQANLGSLDILSSAAGGGVLDLSNGSAGLVGNVAITKTGDHITVSGMSGGLDEVNLRTVQAAIAASGMAPLAVLAGPTVVTVDATANGKTLATLLGVALNAELQVLDLTPIDAGITYAAGNASAASAPMLGIEDPYTKTAADALKFFASSGAARMTVVQKG